MKQCLRNCDCHFGVPFDQCECICPAWCYNEEFEYVLRTEPEPFIEFADDEILRIKTVG